MALLRLLIVTAGLTAAIATFATPALGWLGWGATVGIGLAFVGLVLVPVELHRDGCTWPEAFVRAITHGA